ncbi:uncharacterized protein LOC115956926 [Quercus lobata]|uniref:uncharacterized protein LOC115956926 n=1 Tax=Quercus lobata TaxID=97700 RepID=UPI0012492EE4|nr:uncharacterized protein LOC115956926 [Quercus lobata]
MECETTRLDKVRLHDNPLPLCNVAGFAKTYLQDFKEHTDSSPIIRNRSTPHRWSPPAAGSVKINFDGAMFGESDRAGLGVVIRSCQGQVVAALSEQITKPPTVEILELLAARRAVSFSAELEHLRCVCEGDSLSVVNALKGSGLVLSSGGHLLADISSLSNSFQSISFAHVGRQGNAVAHALAQRARSSLSTQIWLECVPTDIMSIVMDNFPNS